MYRILVVDDEENIREVIKEYAEFEGHQVSEACDGMQAIEMVKNNDYDIIIMDVMMPRLDGYSACKEIRKIKQIPVLMLSARGEEYDKLFGFEIGIDDYVVKPFSPKELMMRVKVVIDRNGGRDFAGASGSGARNREVRRAGDQLFLPRRVHRRSKGEPHPEGVRPSVLSRAQ